MDWKVIIVLEERGVWGVPLVLEVAVVVDAFLREGKWKQANERGRNKCPLRPKVGTLFFLLLVIGLPNHGVTGDADRSLDVKYMHYRDKNGVVNHTPALSFFTRLTQTLGLKWDQELDAVTGASRRLGLKNIGTTGGNDSLLDGITGASRREWRHSEKASLILEKKGRGATASFHFSDENDYTSLAPSLSGQWEFNGRNTTLAAAWSGFFDEMQPQGRFEGRGGKRSIQSWMVSTTQIISPFSLFSLSVNPIHSSGYLGHPYNPILTETGTLVEEELPQSKLSIAMTGKWIQGYRWGERLGSVHVEFRRTDDDWGLWSHTGDLLWHQYLTQGGGLRLRVRRYQQGEANFYKNIYQGDERFRTADIRFSSFSSWTFGVKWFSSDTWGDRWPKWLQRWDVGYDWGLRNTRGELGGGEPARHYQLFDKSEFFQEGIFMVGMGFDW
jgi:hypothetical protein